MTDLIKESHLSQKVTGQRSSGHKPFQPSVVEQLPLETFNSPNEAKWQATAVSADTFHTVAT